MFQHSPSAVSRSVRCRGVELSAMKLLSLLSCHVLTVMQSCCQEAPVGHHDEGQVAAGDVLQRHDGGQPHPPE